VISIERQATHAINPAIFQGEARKLRTTARTRFGGIPGVDQDDDTIREQARDADTNASAVLAKASEKPA